MTRISFEEVHIFATKRWRDADGKRRQKTRKFFQTINPWNLADDGHPKDRAQIMRELSAACDAWLASPEAD